MTKIKKNKDTPGKNKTYNIGKRKDISRAKVVAEIKKGLHPGAHLYNYKNILYPRDNPDSSKKDNVNPSGTVRKKRK